MVSMTFNRSFTLLPYWKEWIGKVKERRGKFDTETQRIEIDGVEYSFGGQSITIPPHAVGIFIAEDINALYHRQNIGLKVFYKHPTVVSESMSNVQWGDHHNLIITSKIQNVVSINGTAPRIYDLVFLTDENIQYPAQVTEYVGGKTGVGQDAKRLSDACRNHCIAEQDIVRSNFVEGKFVDFGKFYFGENYKPRLRERINSTLGFGDADKPYQSVPELQVQGKRDVLKRGVMFQKSFEEDKKYLPKDFSVIDYGCNAGFFLRQAFEWGAAYGVGVERQGLEVIQEICYYLRCFNVDIINQLPDETFDMGFFLSMDQHVKFEEFVPKVRTLLYFEGHNIENWEEVYLPKLKEHFKDIKVLGTSVDYGERVLIRALR